MSGVSSTFVGISLEAIELFENPKGNNHLVIAKAQHCVVPMYEHIGVDNEGFHA
jgi:hypothetical protein